MRLLVCLTILAIVCIAFPSSTLGRKKSKKVADKKSCVKDKEKWCPSLIKRGVQKCNGYQKNIACCITCAEIDAAPKKEADPCEGKRDVDVEICGASYNSTNKQAWCTQKTYHWFKKDCERTCCQVKLELKKLEGRDASTILKDLYHRVKDHYTSEGKNVNEALMDLYHRVKDQLEKDGLDARTVLADLVHRVKDHQEKRGSDVKTAVKNLLLRVKDHYERRGMDVKMALADLLNRVKDHYEKRGVDVKTVLADLVHRVKDHYENELSDHGDAELNQQMSKDNQNLESDSDAEESQNLEDSDSESDSDPEGSDVFDDMVEWRGEAALDKK